MFKKFFKVNPIKSVCEFVNKNVQKIKVLPVKICSLIGWIKGFTEVFIGEFTKRIILVINEFSTSK